MPGRMGCMDGTQTALPQPLGSQEERRALEGAAAGVPVQLGVRRVLANMPTSKAAVVLGRREARSAREPLHARLTFY